MQLVVVVQFLPLFLCPFVFVVFLQEPLLSMLIILQNFLIHVHLKWGQRDKYFKILALENVLFIMSFFLDLHIFAVNHWQLFPSSLPHLQSCKMKITPMNIHITLIKFKF